MKYSNEKVFESVDLQRTNHDFWVIHNRRNNIVLHNMDWMASKIRRILLYVDFKNIKLP
jgi:hypothetical protein